MVISSPLSDFLALWSSHCQVKIRHHGDDSADPDYQNLMFSVARGNAATHLVPWRPGQILEAEPGSLIREYVLILLQTVLVLLPTPWRVVRIIGGRNWATVCQATLASQR